MTQQSLATAERPVSRASSVAASAGVGVIAAAIGYLVAYVAVAGEVRDTVGESAAEWKGVAWYFYNAHLVDVRASGEVGAIGGSRGVDFIAQSGSASATLLYVVPPLVLLGVGAMVAYHLEAGDLGEAVLAGAPVTIGYAIVMAIGAVVTESSTEGSFFGIDLSGSVAPELVPAVFLGGVLYPLVFATAGAVLATVLASR
ncbi:hypothetical protein [Natrarchaeobius oligotrophus]|uniref:DUF7978 domain-containing protein n=1 Tax=Natrarchaeobius chitinivorans TaxID=1679083 RepID=A0A3N6M301_NATCH|nr:hypothetical protein [Natrarchaeobius chitinivorans]RQG96217.1 hypothetical protein EA472_20720 [Natrarchaeobius chitinivorans]